FGGYALIQRKNAVERARLAQEFGQEVAHNAAMTRMAALLPLHDTREERKSIEASLKELQLRKLSAVAKGPAHYALGRGYLDLERFEDARRELEQAWALDYRTPETAYALGLAYTRLYRRALRENPDDKAESERRLRDPALAYLRQAST